MTSNEIADLPIKQCQKLGLVVAVHSEVLGETIVLAPTLDVPGEHRVVYTWREAYILAKAQLKPGPLKWLHALKMTFAGSVLESVTKDADGQATLDVKGVPPAALSAGEKDKVVSSPEAQSYRKAQERALKGHQKRVDLAAARKRYSDQAGVDAAASYEVTEPPEHFTPPQEQAEPTIDAYPLAEPQLLTGSSLASLLPRKPSQAVGK